MPIAIDTVAPLQLADEKKDYDRVQELARTWQRRKQLDEDFENLYWMRRQESAPKEDEAGEEIISPKCMDAINLGVDLLTTRSPNFTVVPLDDDRAAKQEAEQAALWLKSFFYALQRQQRRPFFSALVHHALLLGRCVCRAVLIEDAPKGKLPVRLSVRDPKFF
ncbi:MAG TPA: hypothetical protein VGQ96_00295, partial [Candidatus Eremiobacteraceae bacterium]|nr:hypothetical protein [Candidatus Eremiobacteraceae bacterium]